MKIKYVFLLCFLGFAPLTSNAQLLKGYGIKLGTVGAKQTWSPPSAGAGREIPLPDASGRRWGFDAAGFVELFNIWNVNLLGELHYAQKGVSFKKTYSVDEYGDTVSTEGGRGPRIDYLSIPVMAKARFSLGAVSPYLVIGPRLDFLVGKDTLTFIDVAQGYELKKTNFGGTIGIGVEFARAFPFTLMTEVRYSPDFTNALEELSRPEVKNRSFEVLLGARF